MLVKGHQGIGAADDNILAALLISQGNNRQSVRLDEAVRIDEKEQLSLAVLGPGVSGLRRTAMLCQPQEFARILLNDRNRTIGRTVVDNNDFKVIVCGAIDSIKAVSNGLFTVVVRNNNGDEGGQRKPRANRIKFYPGYK